MVEDQIKVAAYILDVRVSFWKTPHDISGIYIPLVDLSAHPLFLFSHFDTHLFHSYLTHASFKNS